MSQPMEMHLRTDPEAIAELRANLEGIVLSFGDKGYDEARSIWNAMIDRRPALIVRCVSPGDVAAAVGFAREHKLPLSVKSGGHGVAGKAVCDGGVMIDLSPMQAVDIDPLAKTARVQAGVTLGPFDQATHEHGLATTAGIAVTTGIAGLTLGGGLGFLMRRFGLTCDNLLSADVVTAAGEMLTASRDENADLFWGLRGGGGNFGVVTSFTYRLHEIGPTVVGGRITHRLADAPAVARFYRDVTTNDPDELSLSLAFGSGPGDSPTVSFVVCYSGPPEDADTVVGPIRAFGEPIADTVRSLSYLAMQSLYIDSFPYGRLRYWKSSFLDRLSDEAIDMLIAQSAASPRLSIDLERLGGAVARVDPTSTAFADRTAMYSLLVAREWTDPAETVERMREARSTWQALQPYARASVYVNYMDAEDETRVEAAYGPNYARLAALKATYDPENLFRLNQNVVPLT